MERVCVFIDSGNFYHIVLKKLGIREIEFNFDGFTNFLVGERQIIKEGKRFYVATVREGRDNHENRRAMAHQTKLFTTLKKSNWEIKPSKLRTRKEIIKIDDRVYDYQKLLDLGIKEIRYERSREKGVDVKIAVDLMVGAIDNKYDTAILVSSDTDLFPAMDWVRNRYKNKKKIEYVGFSIPQEDDEKSTRPTNTMIYYSDIQRVLIETDLKPFITQTLFNKSN